MYQAQLSSVRLVGEEMVIHVIQCDNTGSFPDQILPTAIPTGS